jgi:hypothetical protein
MFRVMFRDIALRYAISRYATQNGTIFFYLLSLKFCYLFQLYSLIQCKVITKIVFLLINFFQHPSGKCSHKIGKEREREKIREKKEREREKKRKREKEKEKEMYHYLEPKTTKTF